MEFNGREVDFELTIGALGELGSIAPNGDIARIGEELDFANGMDVSKIQKVARLAAALSRGWANAGKLKGEEREPLSEAEILASPVSELTPIIENAMAALGAGYETSVKAEPTKKGAKAKKAEAAD